MAYTRERLLQAVREAGRDGQPFTLGAIREQLGLKTRDKRELKRFRSRFRECRSTLGVEKLGPNTFRLKPGAAGVKAGTQALHPAEIAARIMQSDRVDGGSRRERRAAKRASSAVAEAASEASQALLTLRANEHRGLGAFVRALFDRMRHRNTATTALSRLALDLQPNSSNFQYRCVDGDLRVTLADQGER